MFAKIRSRYDFFVSDRSGAESSLGEGSTKFPNHSVLSFMTWKKDASSSSNWISASSGRLAPSNEFARLSCKVRQYMTSVSRRYPYFEKKERAEVPTRHGPL